MLDALFNITKNFKKLNEDKLVKEALSDKALQDEIIRMNMWDQLYEKGIDSKGDPLGHYSPNTIEGTSEYPGKKELGERYDHITLHNEGIFYDSGKVKNEDKDFIIMADTKKGDKDLATEFGPAILGLTNEHIGYIIPEVKNSVIDSIRKKVRA